MTSKIVLKPLTDRTVYKSEKQLFNDIVITPYEKVIRILHTVSRKLQDIKEVDLSKDIEYVIDKIESRSLYTYSEQYDNSDSVEMHSMIETLNEYSESTLYRKSKKTGNLSQVASQRQAVRYNTMQSKFDTNSFKRGIDDKAEVKQKDKMLKSICKHSTISSPEKTNVISKILVEKNPEILTKDFNILNFYKEAFHPFSTLSKVIIKELDLDKLINVCNLDSFLTSVKNGYEKAPNYHNEIHGADVFHTLFTYFHFSNDFEETLKFSKISTLTLLLSGLCHDIGHPGLNNNFHINSQSPFALAYNDKSVLESYHASEASKILLEPRNNILDVLDKDDFKAFRKQFIESILATDMTLHARTNSVLRSRLASCGGDPSLLVPENEDKAFDVHQEIFNFLLHTADISHNSKKFSISYEWTMRLSEEFWCQGDKEKELGLPISFLCDRENADIPKSQIGFIMSIILPTFEILIDILPSLGFLMTNIKENIDEWTKRKEESESSKKDQQIFRSNNNSNSSVVQK